MTKIKFSDIINSLENSTGTMRDFLEQLASEKEKFDMLSKNMILSFVFMGYGVDLDNIGQEFIHELKVSINISDDKLREEIKNVIEGLKIKKGFKELDTLSFYKIVKNFNRVKNIEKIMEKLKSPSHNYYELCVGFSFGVRLVKPDTNFEVKNLLIDLSE